MASSFPELPNDLASCHALIGQLQAEAQRAAQQSATWESKAREAEARTHHLEALVAEQRETIATYEETIEHLTADNKLLKRCIFGSRRERYTDDPNQILLFDAETLNPGESNEDAKDEQELTAQRKKKRTSKGRRRRIFPDFIPREDERHYLDEADISEEMRDHPNARRFFKKVGERIELIPMQFKVIDQYQEVLAVDQPDETTTMISAKRPPTVMRRSTPRHLT